VVSGSGADGSFFGPSGIAVGSDGYVYVTENDSNSTVNQHRVQKFTSSGNFVTKWGALGHGPSEFNSPLGIAVAPSGNVYVADSGNDRIQVFTSDGTLLFIIGTHGPSEGDFVAPFAIAIDDAGFVYVVEGGFNAMPRVQKFSEDGSFVTSWGSYGTGQGQFEGGSFGIAVDEHGSVYVADPDRVQKFTSGGGFLTQWGSRGSGEGQFELAWGVAIDSDENVYVVDARNHRVQKFGSLPTPTHSTTWGRLKSLFR
jgi:tripartite motif-containing protein 71